MSISQVSTARRSLIAARYGTKRPVGALTRHTGHPPHTADVAGRTITTPRLRLRPWDESDAEAALEVFGTDDVARWLAPAMRRVPDVAAMRELIRRWSGESAEDGRPTGRLGSSRTRRLAA